MYTYSRLKDSRATYEESMEIYQQRIIDSIEVYEKYVNKDGFFIRPCPYCGSDSYYEAEKFHGKYGVVKCKCCNSLYVNPCPKQEVLNDYYAHSKCNELLERVYQRRAKTEKNEILDTRVIYLASYIEMIDKRTINVLELGCSNGSFLAKLKKFLREKNIKKKIRCIGVDANQKAIESSCDAELELHYDTAEHFLEHCVDRFDLVWHTELIEHIVNPYDLFIAVRKKMNDGAYMIFTTPNSYSLEMKNISYNVPRILACDIFPPMHLNAFSILNITTFALRTGFSVVNIETPGIYDVDMLDMQKNDISNQLILNLLEKEDAIKGMVQQLFAQTGASSHMRCVLQV